MIVTPEHKKLLHDIYKKVESRKMDDSGLGQFTYEELRKQLSHYRMKFRLTGDVEYKNMAIAVDKEITQRLLCQK